MKQRCFNVKHSCYPRYGGRGIRICEAWLDYKTFEAWMIANEWEPGLTIDRINNDGDYEPGNCQILTRSFNSHKKGGIMATREHKKGAVAPGKVNRNWRILKAVDDQLPAEAELRGFGKKGTATFINNLLTRYFNGEIIMRGQ